MVVGVVVVEAAPTVDVVVRLGIDTDVEPVLVTIAVRTLLDVDRVVEVMVEVGAVYERIVALGIVVAPAEISTILLDVELKFD